MIYAPHICVFMLAVVFYLRVLPLGNLGCRVKGAVDIKSLMLKNLRDAGNFKYLRIVADGDFDMWSLLKRRMGI